MSTFTLPTTAWSSLLPIIDQDAQPGDVIEVHTASMAVRSRQAVQDAGREDLRVVLVPPAPGRGPPPEEPNTPTA